MAYKDGHKVCDGDGICDAPPIRDQGQENVNQSNAVASNTENPVNLEVFDSAPRKWAKSNLPKQQQAAPKRSHDMLVSPLDVNRPPHQLFDQFFDVDLIEYLRQQANLYASFKGKITFSVDKDD